LGKRDYFAKILSAENNISFPKQNKQEKRKFSGCKMIFIDSLASREKKIELISNETVRNHD